MVDAFTSATLARFPATAETAIDGRLAVDGIDELLRGFRDPRPGRAKLFDGDEFTVAVIPSDADQRGGARRRPEAHRGRGRRQWCRRHARRHLRRVYLALWNRGDQVAATGRPDVLGVVVKTTRVSWA